MNVLVFLVNQDEFVPMWIIVGGHTENFRYGHVQCRGEAPIMNHLRVVASDLEK